MTGVQTCALPIWRAHAGEPVGQRVRPGRAAGQHPFVQGGQPERGAQRAGRQGRVQGQGGRVARGCARTSREAFLHLHRDMVEVFPELARVRLTHGWVGSVGYTFDELPHLGVHDGIHFALGYCGTGVSRSTWFGRKIAERMLGLPEGRSAFEDLPLPSHLFQAFARPAVPVVEGWHRLHDALDRRANPHP